MLFKASAPGSLMLLGEYAVLHGHFALACAIDKRMTVSLAPRLDKKIILHSALGNYETDLVHFHIVPPFQFVLTTLHSLKKYVSTGCDITIEADFSATIGFASSAAVTVATLAAIGQWINVIFSEEELIRRARNIVRQVQGLGSGTDVAAAVLGGMIAYRVRPFFYEKLAANYPLTVVYSGSKTPTAEAVKLIEKKFTTQPKIFQMLLRTINQCVVAGIDAVKKSDWHAFGELLTIQQGMMSALGVNTPTLNGIIEVLHQQPSILGAKISGSGLGDCVVGLGAVDTMHFAGNASQIKVAMTQRGVFCEKN